MSSPKGPYCVRCGCRHYYKTEASFDKRPRYVCAACGDAWTCGRSGGKYAGHEKGRLPEWHEERKRGYP